MFLFCFREHCAITVTDRTVLIVRVIVLIFPIDIFIFYLCAQSFIQVIVIYE